MWVDYFMNIFGYNGCKTFTIGTNNDQKFILCLKCKSVSYNSKDIENKYCKICNAFHQQ